jgi:REP element-mobilizing transposase RayT
MPSFKFETSTKLSLRPQETQNTVFQPADGDIYNLSYACLLIPRFHSHFLAGDLVEYLYVWMQEICVSYGWKLDSLDVQTEYLQWLVDVSVSESPAKIVQTVRQQTSKNIFEDFPRFRKQNSGKDFWAPGHLVIVANQLHSPQMIQEFINITRQQQATG